MKKILTFAGVLLIALSSCQKQEGFKLTAKELPADLNGRYAYINTPQGIGVDSVLIENGKFEYTAPIDTTEVRTIDLNGTMIPFFIENGSFVIVPSSDEAEGGKKSFVIEGPEESNTVIYGNFGRAVKESQEPFAAYRDSLYQSVDQNQPTEEQITKIQELMGKMQAAHNEVVNKYYNENKNRAVAPLIFKSLSLSEEDFIREYEAANDMVKNDEQLKRQYDLYLGAQKTSAGNKYVDFTMDNSIGETKAFSEYMEDGKYLLVDFFASWCGPCMAALPKIAALEKKYGSKGLNVVSIGVWEKNQRNTMEEAKANNDRAIEKENIYWNTFFDSKNAGADAYGVSGIPTLLLISPDGTILVRTHNVEDIESKLAELVKL